MKNPAKEKERAAVTLAMLESAITLLEQVSVECGHGVTQRFCTGVVNRIKRHQRGVLRRYDGWTYQ